MHIRDIKDLTEAFFSVSMEKAPPIERIGNDLSIYLRLFIQKTDRYVISVNEYSYHRKVDSLSVTKITLAMIGITTGVGIVVGLILKALAWIFDPNALKTNLHYVHLRQQERQLYRKETFSTAMYQKIENKPKTLAQEDQISRLPKDIHSLILDYLIPCPKDLSCLSRVSRSWFLTCKKAREQAWQKYQEAKTTKLIKETFSPEIINAMGGIDHFKNLPRWKLKVHRVLDQPRFSPLQGYKELTGKIRFGRSTPLVKAKDIPKSIMWGVDPVPFIALRVVYHQPHSPSWFDRLTPVKMIRQAFHIPTKQFVKYRGVVVITTNNKSSPPTILYPWCKYVIAFSYHSSVPNLKNLVNKHLLGIQWNFGGPSMLPDGKTPMLQLDEDKPPKKS